MKLFLLVALLTTLVVFAAPAPTCGPAPADPTQTDAWAVQVNETDWRTEVPGWVTAPAPVCWAIGRVKLTYKEEAAQELVQDPGPWVAGIDFPEDQPCPAQAVAGCYWPGGIPPVVAP